MAWWVIAATWWDTAGPTAGQVVSYLGPAGAALVSARLVLTFQRQVVDATVAHAERLARELDRVTAARDHLDTCVAILRRHLLDRGLTVPALPPPPSDE